MSESVFEFVFEGGRRERVRVAETVLARAERNQGLRWGAPHDEVAGLLSLLDRLWAMLTRLARLSHRPAEPRD